MRPTFKELCNDDPAIAIKALIESLNNPKLTSWLKLDFSVYNATYKEQCYGCGATFTLLTLLDATDPIDPDIFNRHFADHLDCQTEDLITFEDAIDRFRRGDVDQLAEYFETSLPEPEVEWSLNNVRGLVDLPLVMDYYRRLIQVQAAS